MTIARVASPASTDRAYQRLFLRALQDYLRQERRIVKQGDVVTVTINTDEARRHDDPESSEESNGDDDSDTLVDTSVCQIVSLMIYKLTGLLQGFLMDSTNLMN